MIVKKKKKKRNCRIVAVVVLVGYRVKLKATEKRDEYLELARELEKKLRNMKVAVIPIIICPFSTFTKSLIQ